MVVVVVTSKINHGLNSKENLMKKTMIICLLLSMILMGCSPKTQEVRNAPYYQTKEDVVFNTETDNPQSIVIKAETIFIATLEKEQLVIVIDDVRYVGDAKKTTGINTMPIDDVVTNVALEKAVILKGAQMMDKDGKVLFVAQSDLTPSQYLQKTTRQNQDQVVFNLAGRVVYVPIEMVYIEPAQ